MLYRGAASRRHDRLQMHTSEGAEARKENYPLQQIDKPWFRRRTAGFGWQPASWQGWIITLVAVAVVIAVLQLIRH